MSQLLLMQQTERLGQPGSSSVPDDGTGNHDNQTAEHAGSSTADASLRYVYLLDLLLCELKSFKSLEMDVSIYAYMWYSASK